MTGDEPQGTMGSSFPPSFARTFSSKERRLGTRQVLMYDLPRENVKVERGSSFTFTRDLPYSTSILHVLACHLKITRQWKSTLSKPA